MTVVNDENMPDDVDFGVRKVSSESNKSRGFSESDSYAERDYTWSELCPEDR